MDNNLLKQLIAQHRRVVIPDFGAFLKKEGPEGEQLVFSPFLRKDDGVVTDAIIGEYGVESEDARAMVAEFVIYLRQSLAASGRYYIEGVGMLAADANGSITLREGERPPLEPQRNEAAESVEQVEQIAEAIPVSPMQAQTKGAAQQPSMRPPMPQQVRMQGQPQTVPPVQHPQQGGGMTRPQPIQVPPQPQSFGGYPGIPQQAPLQQTNIRPPMPQQPVQQQMARPQPIQQPTVQQPMRGPMPGAGMPQQQPMRSPIPPSQRQQPMQGNSMPGGGFGGNGSGMPPRGPQDPNMPQQHQQRPGGPGMNGGGRGPRGPQQPGAIQQGGRRPAPRRSRPPKTRADLWLIVAIIAALVVIAIMIYSFIVSGNKGDIDMDMINAAWPTESQDTTVVVRPGEGGL